MNFDSLPLEIIYKIFSLLTDRELKSVAFVSKQWHKIAKDPFLRANFVTTLSNFGHINYLTQKYRRLRSITIYGHIDCESWVTSLPENFHLRRLYLSNCDFKSTATLSKLFKLVPCLYELHFSDCIIDEFDCPTSIEDCKSLKILYIGPHHQYNHNHTCMDIFLQKCTNIEQLHMTCDCVCDVTFKTKMFAESPNLEEMYIRCESLSKNSYPLLRNYHQMTKLYLRSAHQLTDKGLIAIKELQRLQVLDINSFSNANFVHLFDGASFYDMTLLCLEELPNIQSYTIELIAESCPALRLFMLTNCLHNLDDGLCILVKKCNYLEALFLAGLILTTGKFLKDIAKNVPNLNRLTVDDCDLLSLRELSFLKTQRPKIWIIDPHGTDVEFSYSYWLSRCLLERYDALKLMLQLN